jgi:hypothetical protein
LPSISGFRLALALLASFAALAAPHPAAADGDPASDVLLTRPVFVPYGAPVSAPLTQQLETTIARARRAGYAIRVAVIASPYDLGAVSSLYGKPQEYAKFLSSELTFLYHGRLLIVMPQGFGYYDSGGRHGPELRLLQGVKPGRGSDRLVAAATQAVARLARATGHSVTVPPVASERHGHGRVLLLAGGLVAAAILAFALGLVVWLRRGTTLQDS